MMKQPHIVGILNITPDSFSDGGLYLDPKKALQKALELISEGADMIDMGAESSHPDGRRVSAEEEIERLIPVIEPLKKKGINISVDTYKPKVMEAVLKQGVDMINDITALRDPEAVSVMKHHKVPVVIMFAKNPQPQAERQIRDHTHMTDEILTFFKERLRELEKAGIEKERLIIDPGMGLFLGANPEPSLKVLHDFQRFKTLGVKTYLSTSRKSFIGTLLKRGLSQREPGTLATEIWATLQGVDYLRTHDVAALHDAITMLHAIQNIK